MYAYIKGYLEEIEDDYVVIDNNGIGYRIFTPASTLHGLSSIGMEVKLFTYVSVREDAFLLYGFLDRQDREVFKQLLSVSGIGPKGALAVLSVLTTDELRFAILAGDDKTICKVPGIGKKMAQKMIIELRDKLDLADVLTTSASSDAHENSMSVESRNDAIEALVALGYNATESMRAVSSVENASDLDVEEVIRQALKHLAF